MENNNLFREKSLKKISSPEALNDYIKVANPGVWMVIISIIILISGALVCSFFFNMEETVQSYAYTENGKTIILVSEDDFSDIDTNCLVKIDDEKYSISNISKTPIEIDDSIDSYFKHVLGLKENEWAYVIEIDTAELNAPNEGVSVANIITNSFTPSSLIFN